MRRPGREETKLTAMTKGFCPSTDLIAQRTDAGGDGITGRPGNNVLAQILRPIWCKADSEYGENINPLGLRQYILQLPTSFNTHRVKFPFPSSLTIIASTTSYLLIKSFLVSNILRLITWLTSRQVTIGETMALRTLAYKGAGTKFSSCLMERTCACLPLLTSTIAPKFSSGLLFYLVPVKPHCV